jgi:hypothetical protein
MPANVFGIRFALTGICAVTAFGFVVQPGQAQPGRPPGGISGMPGGISGIGGSPLRPPGGITGMPGGITGIHGAGITGIHGAGIAGIHGAGIAGGIAGMPGGIHGIHGGGIGGLPGLPGQTTYSWTCGKCKAHLGTTTTPHSHHTRCPVCGVLFTGTTINPGGGGGGGGAPGGFAPIPNVPVPPPVGGGGGPDDAAPLPVNPAAGGPAPVEVPSEPAPEQGANAPQADPEPQAHAPRAFKIVALLIGTVMLLVGIAALVMVVRNAGGQTARRPRRRFEDDDE